MEGSLTPKDGDGILTLKGLMVIVGAISAGLGGLLLLYVDWDTPELLDKAKRYVDEVRRYLAERDNLLALDDRRRALLEMQKDIYEACELTGKDVPLDEVVKTIVSFASANLIGAIGFEASEKWAFSVFRRVGDGETAEMKRIAACWADRKREAADGRSWKKKEGLTGWAWHDRQEVVVENVRDAQWGGRFMAPEGKQKADDPARYVSAASIPIEIGEADEIWGVVTATSSATRRFRRDPSDVQSQAVETVRVVARLIAMQVALRN